MRMIRICLMTVLSIPMFAQPVPADDTPGKTSDDMIHVALVFDDGPIPELNARFLEFFKDQSINVTFAQVAQKVEEHPEVSKAILAEGHEIVNHSYAHRHPADLSDSELQHEIGGAQKVFINTLEYTPQWYWPPFLEQDQRVIDATLEANVTLYRQHHLVVSKDYDQSVSAGEIFRLATTDVRDGSVILFHEWREETLEQLPKIIATLKEQQCVFMTFTDLHTYVASLDP